MILFFEQDKKSKQSFILIPADNLITKLYTHY